MPTQSFSAQITFVPVADLAASAQFYETVLLLRLEVDQGNVRIYRVAAGGYLGLCQSDSPLGADERLILTLVTDDVDDWHQRLVTQGVSVDGTPRLNERYQIYHFFARDPDSYRLEIQRFLHPFPAHAPTLSLGRLLFFPRRWSWGCIRRSVRRSQRLVSSC
ncbi:VOC family protein [Candidatus Gracilibacteria bacterium]|nr:VOC family protein [Candidatus Gracilibacteria bacterium]